MYRRRAAVTSQHSALESNLASADGQRRSGARATGQFERHGRRQRSGSIAENRCDAGRCASVGGGLGTGGYRPVDGEESYADEAESGNQSAAELGHVPSVVADEPAHHRRRYLTGVRHAWEDGRSYTVAARGFLAPGGKCHICRPPQAHDILWGCIERPFFFTSLLAFSALNPRIQVCFVLSPVHPLATPLSPPDWYQRQQKNFLPPSFGAPSLCRPGAIATLTISRRHCSYTVSCRLPYI
jgi:hypothetical protein